MVSLIDAVNILFISSYVICDEFHLYYMDQTNKQDISYDCLYYRASDNINEIVLMQYSFKKPYQIIPYCVRSFSSIEGNISSQMIFEDLRRRNITTSDLLSQSAAIDLIELYDEYLSLPFNVSLRFEKFYNCSTFWFGPYCQYTFGTYPRFNTSLPFHIIVNKTFYDKNYLDKTPVTCYTDLQCHRGPAPACLDWREICDGKVDCFDSDLDEIHCLELEINECEANEYRCHNGQCIPEEFAGEGSHFVDCLDGTDENNDMIKQIVKFDGLASFICYNDPGFWCEESDFAKRSRFFVCGDGERSDQALLHTSISPFLRRCRSQRDEIIKQALFSYIDRVDLSYDCWFQLYCSTIEYTGLNCSTLCENHTIWGCSIDVREKCPTDYVIFPQRPVFQGHVQLVYLTNKTIVFFDEEVAMFPEYVCYDVRKCPFLPTISLLNINGTTCRLTKEFGLYQFSDIHPFFQACLTVVDTNLQLTSATSLFQCPGTPKYISKHRVLDGRPDCYQNMDETNINTCSWNDHQRFKCSSKNKCLSPILLENQIDDCSDGEDERINTFEEITFAKLCNGYEHLSPIFINGFNQTDETHCEHWPCNNIYTRCDGAWHCPNGADELNCEPTDCPRDTHECVSPSTKTVICLPVQLAGNGIVDCLGATDERDFCRKDPIKNARSRYKCWNENYCIHSWEACPSGSCLYEDDMSCSEHAQQVFNRLDEDQKLQYPERGYFLLEPSTTNIVNSTVSSPDTSILPLITRIKFATFRTEICHRGIFIYTGKNMTMTCLCPPSYYGDRCQYQNKRVSLSLQFTRICEPECTGIYAMIVTLIDEDHIIHDYEQITYTTTYKCNDKFFIYLQYQSPPKNLTKTYHIRIDAYDKINVSYYSSWILPVKFLFLPVHKISGHLYIPPNPVSSTTNCSKSCVHGRCVMYVNQPNEPFCRCDSNWSGIDCSIPLLCNCATDSHCFGKKNNRSICLCSLNKYGPRCRLSSICQNHTCQNGGRCVPNDQRISRNKFTCICPQGYFGSNCQLISSEIQISFKQIDIPRSLRIHFLTIQTQYHPLRTTITTKIPYDRDVAIVYTSLAFHLIIAQTLTDYYLIYINANYTYSPLFNISMEPKQKCPHIETLFTNKSILSYSSLHRVKYYHLLCQDRSPLKCFHDKEEYMCLCHENRFANCFPFDFKSNSTCKKIDNCQNDAQCFSDRPQCPYSVFCVCTDCFYGSKCQFTAKDFGLSLDAILGYHIQPKVSISHQPTLIKISLASTVIVLSLGLINSISSIMTFQKKKRGEPGCRKYLLATSIVSLCINILFSMKFLMLMLSQLAIITNLIALKISCISIDFLLRLSLIVADWIISSVSIERVLSVILGLKFNKKKSKKAVKWVLSSIVLIGIMSIVPDLIYRTVIYDEDEDRRWCLVQYPSSSSLETYNSIINILHFFVPFIINFVAGILIIFVAARTRSAARPEQTYSQILRAQFSEHKHLIISSISLVLLATPRLFISFLSGCMKSPRNPSFYLAGYFISFTPSCSTFFVFILPSKVYMNDFSSAIRTFTVLFKP